MIGRKLYEELRLQGIYSTRNQTWKKNLVERVAKVDKK